MERILLVLLPFWTPLIPPIGIACLKSFLERYGYQVRTVDASVEDDFKVLYHRYFEILAENVPENKKGNFYSLGHDVLRNHMMAHMNASIESKKTDEPEYLELVKILIYKTFYVEVENHHIFKLKKILDEFYDQLEQYLIHLLEKEKPDVLGLSVFSDTLPASVFAFKLAKKKYPLIKTVMGGGIFADLLAYQSESLKIFLKKTEGYIDKVIIGEGEHLFLEWLSGKLPETRRVYTLKDINGKTMDLFSSGILNLSDFDLERYPYMVSYTSRSCPFQCKFCSETVQWGKYRKKGADQIVEELTRLYEKRGFPLFLLSDSLLNPVIDDLADEFLRSDRSRAIYWGGWLRVDKQVCDIEKTLKWRQSGFYHARIGVESGSPRVLESMGKRITIEQTKRALANLANAGIKTTTLWVIGLPGETGQDFMHTLELIKELRNDIYEAECRPFYFYLNGQVGSTDWYQKHKVIPLYPEKAIDMLMLQTWILDCQPSRKETYQRVNRFVEHCKKLDIPNPYSIQDIVAADERWKKLHKNAVPPVVELIDTSNLMNIMDEKKNIKKLNAAVAVHSKQNNGDFDF